MTLPKVTKRTLTSAIDEGYLSYAMYVLESRAIPSAIDGLKAVTRKLLYAMLTEHKGKKVKVADLGGISKYNYHHAEASAIEAAVKLARGWDNNFPLFEQHGNFGSRLVTDSAGPRYINASLSENYYKFFQDTEVVSVATNPRNPEPLCYLPIIPWVLLNGVGGMAVGFKTEILPRAAKDLLKATKACLADREKFLADDATITPSFPRFSGEVVQKSANQWKTRGLISYSGKYTYEITELPIGYDRAEYLELLDKMSNEELIRDYEDKCSKVGFGFSVKVSIAQKTAIDADPIKYFSLERTHTELLSTIGIDGKLKVFESVAELIAYFCDYRTIKFDEKIQYDRRELIEEINRLNQKKKFIKDVVMNKIDFRKVTKVELLQYVADNITESEYGKSLIRIPLYECTPEEVKMLIEKINQFKAELDAMSTSSGVEIFNKRLAALKL